MYPFWDFAIMPTLRAARARRIVEIGALRGETTVKMIKELGRETELHVIDPVPEFDPTTHEREFPGQYIFHRDLSLNVLGTLPVMDAALVDGDHNWYTVFNELRLLREVADAAGRPLPLLLLHDVEWPYGRRDLYYDPANIPAEHLQRHRRAGIHMRSGKLVERGGFNKTLHNAEEYGGPRNGVMSGLEDFLDLLDRPFRHVRLPIYYGLSIVAEDALLAERPELVELLDSFESADGKDEIIGLSERIRLDAAHTEQNYMGEFMRRVGVLQADHLSFIKKAVVNELFPEADLRLDAVAEGGRVTVDDRTLHDPIRRLRPAAAELVRLRLDGDAGERAHHASLTSMGRRALDQLHSWLDESARAEVPGDVVNVGIGRGGVALFTAAHRRATFRDGIRVWAFDRFEATTPGDLNTVRDAFERFGLLDENVRFVSGPVAPALSATDTGPVALLCLRCDDPVEITSVLEAVADRMSVGGRIVVHSRHTAARDAAAAAAGSNGAFIERPDDHTVSWRVNARVDPPARSVGRSTAGFAPLAPARVRATDLSVVVVVYDMVREAKRSLRSLTRSYQQGIDDLDYEVIVVENGSPDGHTIDQAWVESLGPEFHYLSMGSDATGSPTLALNRGIASSSGDLVAVMIDGAHVLSPGVLRHAVAGARLHAPAIVATQGFFLGPGQQSEAMAKGYDQAAEDRLLDAIEWPSDGYRLFDIAHFQEGRDWFDGMWESNCLFAPRELLEQIGGFDDAFAEPGGGYANLDLFERLGTHPGVTVVSLLGEGSFHQVHGGTTNNQPSPEVRWSRLEEYRNHFQELRGRPWDGPRKPIHFVGSMHPGARRTKARRLSPERWYFRKASIAAAADGAPERQPIPDDLRDAYLDAFWRSQGWSETAWVGVPAHTTADDLLGHARLVWEARPDWILDVSTGDQGRAHVLAAVCDQLGHGEVVSVIPAAGDDGVHHARLNTIVADQKDDIVAAIAELVPAGSAYLILGGPRRRAELMDLFAALERFVAVGAHAVLEWTVVNGNPICPEYGAGAHEAVRDLRDRFPDFVQDVTVEPAGPSFNRGGYLKRVRASP